MTSMKTQSFLLNKAPASDKKPSYTEKAVCRYGQEAGNEEGAP
jgi:hypothetical protein